MERKYISGGSKWEGIVGYSRAVRVGPMIAVAGTTATGPDGRVVGPGDPYLQAKTIFGKIEKALTEAGSGMKDVVRTRMFVTDIAAWQEIGRAHSEFFSGIRPVATMVQVSGLIEPEMLVEIEVDAFVSS